MCGKLANKLGLGHSNKDVSSLILLPLPPSFNLLQIENYNEVHDAIDQCENRECINGWLALDLKPLKYGLLNLACKWSHLCKQWLLRYVQGTLKVRNTFLKQCQQAEVASCRS